MIGDRPRNPGLVSEPQSWFGEAVAVQAARAPDAPAFVTASHVTPYASLQQSILRLATAMLRRGCRPGETVALLLDRQPIDLVLLFAAHRLGVPVLVLGREDPPELVRALVRASGATRLLSAAGLPPDPGVPALTVDASWLRVPDGDLPPPPGPGDSCYLVRSSGTTHGVPKLVATTHRSETARVGGTLTRLPLAPPDRFLAMFSFGLAYGRMWAQNSLMQGAAVVFPPPPRSVAHLSEIVREMGATWAALTPTYLHALLEAHPGPEPLLPGMRIVVSTAALPPAARRDAIARISSEIYSLYGTNEVGTLTLATPEEVRASGDADGRPDPQTEMQVVDENGRPAPPGTVGPLRFRGPDYPTSYRHSPPGAASRFDDGWFYPGDLGMVDETGQLFLKGRVDDLINVSGAKVYPADIESCLSLHPAMSEVAVVAVPNRWTGSLPVACVVLRRPVGVDELVELCRRRLGPDRSPRRIVVMPDLPKAELGKFDRRALRERLRG